MSASAVLVVELVVVLGGVVALAVWLRRRLGVPWRTWWWGALAFVGAQVVRLPLLALLTMVAGGALPEDSSTAFALDVVVLALSAGLFEEGARWLVLRFGARDARRWADGVVFGAGHGGIEAVLVIGAAVVGSLVLLATGDLVLDATTDRATADAVREQLATVRGVTIGQAALAVWERVLAITFHIAASLLVLRTVRTGAWRWLVAAVVYHAAYNAIAVVIARELGAVAAELVLTALTLLAVWIIVRERRDDALLSPPGPTG